MKLYKEHQVNPLGSCLPLLLQLPFFISLFYMQRTDLKKDICPPAIVRREQSVRRAGRPRHERHERPGRAEGAEVSLTDGFACRRRRTRVGELHTGFLSSRT